MRKKIARDFDYSNLKKQSITEIFGKDFEYLCIRFLENCMNDHYTGSQYIYQRKPDVVWNIYDAIFDKYKHLRNKGSLFSSRYNSGDMRFVIWIYKINSHIDIDPYDVLCICSDGHFDIFQWIYDNVAYIRKYNYLIKAFSGACTSNHLAIVEWIYKLNIINNHIDIDIDIANIIKNICWCGCIEVLDFLYANMSNVHAIIEKTAYLNYTSSISMITRLIELGSIFDDYIVYNKRDDEIKRALIPALKPDKLDAESLKFYLKETDNFLPYEFEHEPKHAKIRGRHTKPALRE